MYKGTDKQQREEAEAEASVFLRKSINLTT